MTLEEIFKTNPALMEAPEVKYLIEYVQRQHGKLVDRYERARKRETDALEIVYNSELFVIGGTPFEEALKNIGSTLV